MSSCLQVMGLGPSGIDQLTLGNYRRIRKAKKIFARTAAHPCVRELMAEGICVESFDEIYATRCSFEEVYKCIVEALQKELAASAEVIYVVPGHPMVAEKTVQLLREKLSPEYEVVIHPALSFIDEIFRVLHFDPIDGVLIRNYDGLKEGAVTGKEWLIIPQVYSQFIASEVKLDLMTFFPDDAEVYILKNLGAPNEQVDKRPLFELDHGVFDHLTTVVLPPHPEVISFARLTEVMAILRSDQGCAWDREQSHDTLKKCLIEESYEVLEAIEKKDMHNLCEELGDLLLQVVFHAQLASEEQAFQMQDVLQGIIHKMIRRHPHVFGEEKAETAAEVMVSWAQIKREEKGSLQETVEEDYFRAPVNLPALMLAASTQKRAAEIGFDWPDMQGPWEKVQEELQELKSAVVDGRGISEELGDVLFSIVNVARFLKLEAEEVLRDTVHKFQRRFLRMAALAKADGVNLEHLSLPEMDVFWDRAKWEEKSGKLAEYRIKKAGD